MRIEPLKIIAETLKLRVVIDVDLRGEIGNYQKLFYYLNESGVFIREVGNTKE